MRVLFVIALWIFSATTLSAQSISFGSGFDFAAFAKGGPCYLRQYNEKTGRALTIAQVILALNLLKSKDVDAVDKERQTNGLPLVLLLAAAFKPDCPTKKVDVVDTPPTPTKPKVANKPKPKKKQTPVPTVIPKKTTPIWYEYEIEDFQPTEDRNTSIPGRIIVFYDDDTIATPLQFAERFEIPLSAIVEFMPTLSAAVIQGCEEDLDRITTHPSVQAVFVDRIATLTSAVPAHTAAQDMVDQSDGKMDGKFDRLKEQSQTRVYVVDGGLQSNHEELSDKVAHWRAIGGLHGGLLADACASHGTGVASLIAGKTVGIAERVSMVDVDITPCDVSNPMEFPASHILVALDWISRSEQQLNDDTSVLVNMSLGFSVENDTDFVIPAKGITGAMTGVDAFEDRVHRFLDKNPKITLVAAAGNAGKDACHYFPARMKRIVTVGGIDQTGAVWPHSNFGPCVDTFAPAFDIAVANSLDQTQKIRRSGTSFAAAVVTGIIASRLNSGQSKTEILKSIMNRDSENIPIARLVDPFRAQCKVATKYGALNFRQGQGTNGKIIKVLRNDDLIEIVKRFENGWAMIKIADGTLGWIATQTQSGPLIAGLDGQLGCNE
ncbi:S8 family serine peptidase [Rhodobacteraceae bacterium]|nr:S8 family serine peptidase [Paracoccaceae bacterium]